jgi:hypothetical protein
MYNKIVVARVEFFKAKGNVATFDTKGAPNVILIPVCGTMPNQAQVIAGTVALSNKLITTEGAIANPLVMVHVTEGKVDDTYGRQFSVGFLGEVKPMELPALLKDLGAGFVEITKAPDTENGTSGIVNNQTNTNNASTPVLSAPGGSGLPEEKEELEEQE